MSKCLCAYLVILWEGYPLVSYRVTALCLISKNATPKKYLLFAFHFLFIN